MLWGLSMIKVAMIGFGGIAQLHRYAYWELNREGFPIRLVAACDTDLEKFKKITRINIAVGEIHDELPFNIYDDYKAMLEKEKPDLVDICLPTKFHELISVEALSMGFSVLCEKPMSEDYESCKRMLNVAKQSKGSLMIAHCVRFQSEYQYLRDVVSKKTYGEAISAEFYRYTGLPDWTNSNWRVSASKSGSCLFDLNIHDIDVVESIWGMPKKLSCKIQNVKYSYDRSESIFYYSDLKVKINSAWLEMGEPFNVGYTVIFENGTLNFENGIVTFIDNLGEKSEIDVFGKDMVTEEIRYFAEVLDNGLINRRNTPDDSARTIYTLEKLFESAELNTSLIDLEGYI